jgi:preprotein translocase subunit SecA
VAERLPRGEEKYVTMRSSSTSSTWTRSIACRAATGSGIFAHFKRETDSEHEQVVDFGGLHILGTERHEARRIDNQLRGRAGRQGDPGSSRFYLSLEDDLMRIFGSDRISGLMQKLGMEEGVPIEHGMVTRAIERAQKQVEAQNFSVRKHLLEYDDVMNKQRESVYTLRREILEGKVHLTEEEIVDTREYVFALAEEILEEQIERFAGKDIDLEEWDVPR